MDHQRASFEQTMFELMGGPLEKKIVLSRRQIHELRNSFNVILQGVGYDLGGSLIQSIFFRSFEKLMYRYYKPNSVEDLAEGKTMFFETRVIPLIQTCIFERYQIERRGRTGTLSGGIEYLYDLVLEDYLHSELRREQMILGIRKRRASSVIQDSYITWAHRPGEGNSYRRAEASYNSG